MTTVFRGYYPFDWKPLKEPSLMIPESIRLEMAAKLMAVATGHDWENMNRGPRQRFYRMARIAFAVAIGDYDEAQKHVEPKEGENNAEGI